MKLSAAQMNVRYQEAIKARRRWLDSLIAGETHYYTSLKWQVYVDLVRHAQSHMAEFEADLKANNYEEWSHALKVRTVHGNK